MNRKNAGFGAVEAVIIVAVVALLAFIGHRVWLESSTDVSSQQTAPAATEPADEAPQINDESDLRKASEALDDVDVDDDSSNQLEAELTY